MDERRNWRGAGHRVGQPDIEWDLRRLADCAEKKEQADRGEQTRIGAQRLRRNFCEIGGGEIGEHQEHRHQKSEIADAIDDECLLACGGGEVFVVKEADQQVRAKPNALPPDKHQQITAAEDQDEHLGEEKI